MKPSFSNSRTATCQGDDRHFHAAPPGDLHRTSFEPGPFCRAPIGSGLLRRALFAPSGLSPRYRALGEGVHGEVGTVGLDIAKSVFQVQGVDADGAVVHAWRRNADKVDPGARRWLWFSSWPKWMHVLARCVCANPTDPNDPSLSAPIELLDAGCVSQSPFEEIGLSRPLMRPGKPLDPSC